MTIGWTRYCWPMSGRLLEGRTALVTGGGRGIGRAVVERFTQAGAQTAVADIDLEAANTVAAAADGYAVRVDVADEASVRAAFDACLKRYGRLDIVVANAGILHLSPVAETSLADWERVLRINLTGAFLTVRTAARRLIDQAEGGRIILTSSLYGTRGGAENGAYSASKFGVVGLMECLAAELAPHDITVNAVCPGQVQTEMMEAFFRDRGAIRGVDPDVIRTEVIGGVPAGRMATPFEVADIFVFLASPLSGYVTGQSVIVDGGLTVA